MSLTREEGTRPLSPFASRLLLSRLANDGVEAVRPRRSEGAGVVMLADLVGFSPMTERLAARPDGAERIRDVLDASLGSLVETVLDHGGDVLKFAGDAVVCFWSGAESSMAGAAAAAIACGLRAQANAAAMRADADARMPLRVCIGSGDLDMLEIGGVGGRWEMLPVGTALSSLAGVRKSTEPGEVVIDAATAQHASGRFTLAAMEGKPGTTRVLGQVAPLPPAPRTPVVLGEAAARALRGFVPPVVLSRLEGGLSDWLSELRTVSVLFASLPGPEASLDGVHEVAQVMQRCVFRLGGAVNKICVDEKGAVLIAAFGVPPASNADDAARAVRAASAMHAELRAKGVPTSIGIATGQVFCGTVGNAERCEYTILGHVVNRAARLMGAAAGRVLCDDPTALRAQEQVELTSVGELELRGHAGRVAAWSPTGALHTRGRARSVAVGRDDERARLDRALNDVLAGAAAASVILLGEAGIGKSILLEGAAQAALASGFRTVWTRGDAVEHNTPYHAWRKAFAEMEGANLTPPHPEAFASSSGQSEEARALARQAELATALLDRAGQAPLALVVEDAHWMDSASWALLRTLRVSTPRLVCFIASRPMEDPPREFAELLADPAVSSLRLGPMGCAHIDRVACERLGVASLPAELVDLVHARAGGNALFAEELVLALRDSGRLVVDNGVARLTVPAEELARGDLPASVEGLVVSRVDSLSPSAQLVVKVASVVGPAFALQVLREVFPIPDQQIEVDNAMPKLVSRELVHDGAALEEFVFRHALTHQAVYALLLFGQRRGLHRSVAQWYETRFAGELDPQLPTLAHHWLRAEQWERALVCLEAAAEQNLRRYANREAIDLLTHALDIDARGLAPSHDERRAHWHRHLMEAWFRLGRLDRARTHGEAALSLLGRPVPRGLLRTVGSLVTQVGLRVLQGYFPGRFAEADEAGRARRGWATRVLNRLTEIHIYANDAAGCLDTGLRELNVSEPAGPSAELGKAYAVMAVALGAAPPLRPLSRRWAARSLALARASASESAAVSYVLSRAAIVDLYDAAFSAGHAKTSEAVKVAREQRDGRLEEEALAIRGITLFFASRFGEAAADFVAMGRSAYRSNNVQVQAWACLGDVGVMLRIGEASSALSRLGEIREWVATKASPAEVLWTQGLQALALHRSGDHAAAEAMADQALPAIRQRPVAYWVQHSLAALAETYLLLWEAAPTAAKRAALRPRAATACLAMRRFGAAFPFALPHALLWDGLFHELDGRRDRAVRSWLACRATAGRLGIPWEGALAARELGRVGAAPATGAAAWSELARSELTGLGARWDLGRLPAE